RRKQFRIVLQVGVHHRDYRRGGSAHALDGSTCQSATTESLNGSNSRVNRRDPPHLICSAVGTVVIDEDGFPTNSRKRNFKPGDECTDISALVIRRKHDRQF